MINRSNRFHGYNSLRFVYRHGQTIRGPLCSIKYIVNRRRTSYRLAVVVNKKVNKSAVVRNKIRRRLYEAIRATQDGIDQPYDLVITVFSSHILDLKQTDLEKIINEQLKEAGILNKVSSAN